MDSKTEKRPIVNGTDEEQWLGNPPPAYPTDNVEMKTVLPYATGSCYIYPDPPMREVYRSIFTLACCFWPFGIIAMLKSLKGIKAYYNGDKTAAIGYNRSALRWNVAAIVIGALILNGIINAIVRTSFVIAQELSMKNPDCNATLIS